MYKKVTQKILKNKIKRLRKNNRLYESNIKLKDGCVLANHEKLDHIWLCVGSLPEYYVDKSFKCRDCGSKEIWKAAKQKNYFEVRKGKHLEALAIRCKKCRELIKVRIRKQQETTGNNVHPNEFFFRDLEEFNK